MIMKDAQLGIRISAVKKKELDAHATKNGLTSSSLVLALIDEELRRPESLSNMYLSITKRFENLDEKFKVLAKTADRNLEVLSKTLERQLSLIEEVEVLNEKDHKAINEALSLDAGVLKSIADILTKLDEKSVTKDELLRILVRIFAEERAKK
jgi:hypothetical protein